MSRLRDVLAGALAIDRTGFEPLAALRGAVGVVIPFAIGFAVGHPAEGSIAAAGALPAGTAGVGGGFRSQADVVITAGVCMAVSTFAGGLIAGHLAATLLVLAVWGFAAGLIVVAGREATIVGTQAVVGLVVFGRFPGGVETSLAHGGWVLAGAALQAVLAALVRPPQRFVAERRTLAHAYAELAILARDASRSTLTAADETARAAAMLARRARGDEVDMLRGLSDEADRIRLELLALATVADVPGVAEARASAARWLDGTSAAVRAAAPPPDEDSALDRAVLRLRDDRDRSPAAPGTTHVRYAAARAAALLGQLRAVDRFAAAVAGARLFVLPRGLGAPVVLALPRRLGDQLRMVSTALRDPRSSGFRHAVRLALVLPAAEALSHALPWQRGYWVTLTAAVVLRPDYAATTQRGIARLVGTGVGVVAAGLLVAAIHPSGAVLTVMLGLATWGGFTCFRASYALYSLGVTAIVVLLLTPVGGSALSTVADRGLDTLVGGALALVAYGIWPTWERTTLSAAVSRLLSALATYAELLLEGYADPARLDRAALAASAAEARRARIAAQASFDRAVAEPPRAGADTATAGGVLAAARRVVIELHALRTTLDDTEEPVAVSEVGPMRTALVDALRGLAAGDPAAVSGLRERQRELAAEGDHTVERNDAADPAGHQRAVVAAHLDPLVDSVDTIAHLLTSERPTPPTAEGPPAWWPVSRRR